MILAVDPGTTKSAYVITSASGEFRLFDFGIVPNEKLFAKIARTQNLTDFVIEMVASYGMAVGQTTFETVFWIGRYWQEALNSGIPDLKRLYRKADICMHMCHSPRAKDSNIRQALIDRFGEPGTKSNPGILYGVSKDVWSALAVAVTYRDQKLTP